MSVGASLTFDPKGLERVLDTLREISRHENAKDAFDLAARKESSKVSELEASRLKHQLSLQKAEKDCIREKEIQARMTISHRESEVRQTSLFHREQLAKIDERKQVLAEEQEAGRERRRITNAGREERQRNKVRLEFEKARVKLETAELRSRHDLRMKEVGALGEALTKSVTRLGSDLIRALSSGMVSTLSSPRKTGRLAGFAASVGGAVFFSRSAAAVFRDVAVAKLATPVLVRNTSVPRGLVRIIPKFLQKTDVPLGRLLPPLVLCPDLHVRFDWLQSGLSTRGPRPIVLCEGPPGVGKTLMSRHLAVAAGVDWALISGSDAAVAGASAGRQLEEVFRWGRARCPNGLLLILDEGESILQQRVDLDEGGRKFLATFLTLTGSESNEVSVVVNSNKSDLLDEAVRDRFTDELRFENPSPDALLQILRNNVRLWLECDQDEVLRVLGTSMRLPWRRRERHWEVDISDDCLREAAKEMEGHSARKVAGFVHLVRRAAMSSGTCLVDDEFVKIVVKSIKEIH